MDRRTRDTIRYLIFKTLGASAFTRWLEWRKMLKWLGSREGEKILDIACGAGDLTLKIAGKGCQVYGIDMSETAIDSARRLSVKAKIKCEFNVGDAEHLPYPDEYFDKVICSSSLEHFKDDSKALGEMRRVLKQEGKIILTADSLTRPISMELKERHRKMCAVEHYYTRENLAGALKNAGLGLCRSEYLLTSSLTSFFFKLWIKHSGHDNLFILITLLSPLMMVSDGLFGKKDSGYTLLAEAKKADRG